jgi:hypothetical protein
MSTKKGQFTKGNPGKPKGTKNKVTQSIRDKFEQLLDGVGVEQMVADLQSIERPTERLNIIMGLAEYLVPKLARTNITHDAGENIEGFELTIKRNRDDSAV